VGEGMYRRLEAKASRKYTIPGTTRTRVAAETLGGWLRLYRDGGFHALVPKQRADWHLAVPFDWTGGFWRKMEQENPGLAVC